jgi:hypothetical protein
MLDFLRNEKYCGGKVKERQLFPKEKERMAIRVRLLMERGDKEHGFIDLPVRDLPLGEKLEAQIHSIKRTTTTTGEHTRYSGKDSDTGLDDMFWALALSVYKEFEGPEEPFLEVYVDDVLKKLQGS